MRKLLALLLVGTLSVSGQNLFKDFDYVTVEGRVVDRSGRAIADVNVEIRIISQGGSDVTVLTTGIRDETKLDKAGWGRTDENGRYRIQGIPAPGSYLVVVKGVKGYKKAQMPLRIDKSGDKVVQARDLVLDPFGAKTDGKTRKLLKKAASALEKGRLDEAKKLLKEADARQPGLSEVHVSLGNIYLKRKQFAAALKEFKQAFELGEQNPQLSMIAAQLSFQAQAFQDAGRFLDSVLAQQPENLQALYLAGVSHYNLKEFERASEYFSRYLKVKGNAGADVNLLYVYGMSELGRGDEASAAALLQQAYDAGWKGDVQFLKTLANLYIKQKNTEKAKAILKDLLEKFPSFDGREQAEQVYNSL